ncbi:hypothetical protein Taro_045309 [Colocasia esculenta]|uniref:Uncharacterized protein n=1 Tax=Colocasia esculenta TaxID=4460 RepID=A0A843X4L3_COLES|nr:hypothetical protein [Colocasia esculenta]
MFFGEECVDTQADYIDTTGNCCRTDFWDSELVLTHRWTVLTPLADCVDTQADCVDTTSYCFRTGFWDSELVSTHRIFFNQLSICILSIFNGILFKRRTYLSIVVVGHKA